tara:strand:- start:1590 stop:2552 length:963 start_codon:yes stop_codon:yes gene_type:complete
MAYTAGDTILDDEYNTFANNSTSPFGYNHFAGTGSGRYGLGESELSTVSPGDTVAASSWNALFTGMSTVAGHTADTLTSRAAISAGDTIAIANAVATDLATLAASVEAGSPNTTAVTTSSTLQTGSSSSTWTGVFTSTFTITFASANALRFFCNAGGKIRVHMARTGNGGASGGATGKDNEWDAIYTAVGNIDIASKQSTRSGSGETLTTDGLANGISDLGTSNTTIITVSSDTYPYTANNLKVEAKLNAAFGTATIVTVTVTATDGAADTTFSNPGSADAQAYRNGTHQHYLKTINTTTGGGLANAYAPSSTGVSASTT